MTYEDTNSNSRYCWQPAARIVQSRGVAGCNRTCARRRDSRNFRAGRHPPFNQDEEQNPPAKVTELKRRIREADAILFVTPEYNYSVSGVLKNAIDWASRPYGDSAWNGKPAAIMGASPGAMGTARAQYHLRQMLVFLNMFPINQPEVMIAHAVERFDQEGNLTDTITKEFILALLQNLVEWTRRIGTAPLQSRVKDV